MGPPLESLRGEISRESLSNVLQPFCTLVLPRLAAKRVKREAGDEVLASRLGIDVPQLRAAVARGDLNEPMRTYAAHPLAAARVGVDAAHAAILASLAEARMLRTWTKLPRARANRFSKLYDELRGTKGSAALSLHAASEAFLASFVAAIGCDGALARWPKPGDRLELRIEDTIHGPRISGLYDDAPLRLKGECDHAWFPLDKFEAAVA